MNIIGNTPRVINTQPDIQTGNIRPEQPQLLVNGRTIAALSDLTCWERFSLNMGCMKKNDPDNTVTAEGGDEVDGQLFDSASITISPSCQCGGNTLSVEQLQTLLTMANQLQNSKNSDAEVREDVKTTDLNE